MKTMSHVTMRKMASEPAQWMILMSPATRGTSSASETNRPALQAAESVSGNSDSQDVFVLQHVHSPLTWSLAKVAAGGEECQLSPDGRQNENALGARTSGHFVAGDRVRRQLFVHGAKKHI